MTAPTRADIEAVARNFAKRLLAVAGGDMDLLRAVDMETRDGSSEDTGGAEWRFDRADEAMAAAITERFGRPCDLADAEHSALWDAAWNHASDTGYAVLAAS